MCSVFGVWELRCSDASGSDILTYLRAGGGQFAAVGVHDGNLDKTASVN